MGTQSVGIRQIGIKKAKAKVGPSFSWQTYWTTRLHLECDASVEQNVYLRITGIIGADQIKIKWGDGSAEDSVNMNGIMNTINHSYAGTEIYTIEVTHPESILLLNFPVQTTVDIYPFEHNVAEFAKALNMETYVSAATDWTGSINDFNKGLKYFEEASALISGTITPFVNLEYCIIHGYIDGDLTPAVNLIHVFFFDNVTVTVDCTGMTSLKGLESYAIGSYGEGDVSTCTALEKICWGTPNAFTGSITALANFVYLDHYGGGSISGVLTAKGSIWKFISTAPLNAFSGNITNLSLLEFFALDDSSTVTKPITLALQTIIGRFDGRQWDFLSAEVNQILSDIWGSRNSARNYPTNRIIYLNSALSEPATGQGIADMVKLQHYRSPNPPGTASLWTINTNNVLGAELLTGWTNYPGYLFETFTTSGKLITSAINNAGGGGACYSNSIGAVVAGEKYICYYNGAIITTGCKIYIGSAGLVGRSNNISHANGMYADIFTITSDAASAMLYFESQGTNECNFNISDIMLKKIIT